METAVTHHWQNECIVGIDLFLLQEDLTGREEEGAQGAKVFSPVSLADLILLGRLALVTRKSQLDRQCLLALQHCLPVYLLLSFGRVKSMWSKK